MIRTGICDDMEEKLKAMNTRVISINKSYLVDLLYIKEFRYNRVKLDNGTENIHVEFHRKNSIYHIKAKFFLSGKRAKG